MFSSIVMSFALMRIFTQWSAQSATAPLVSSDLSQPGSANSRTQRSCHAFNCSGFSSNAVNPCLAIASAAVNVFISYDIMLLTLAAVLLILAAI